MTQLFVKEAPQSPPDNIRSVRLNHDVENDLSHVSVWIPQPGHHSKSTLNYMGMEQIVLLCDRMNARTIQ